MTQLSMYERNEIEWIGKPFARIPLDAISVLRKEEKVNYFPALGLYWYFLNTQSFPFNHKKMRQAFAYALNREEITRHILQENERAALGILPPNLALQKEPYFQDNNQELALRLFNEALSELGITKEELPSLTLNYSLAEVHQKVAEVVQEQWHKVLGIQVKIEGQDWKVHFDKIKNGNFQIGGMIWQSRIRDPLYILETFRFRNDGVNMSRWESSHYQELIAATEEELDLEKRNELFHEAEKILMDEFPVIPVYFNQLTYGKKEHLKDVYISELYDVDFRYAYFDDEEF
jgi:oligopeptide transport system substrate-binding protein